MGLEQPQNTLSQVKLPLGMLSCGSEAAARLGQSPLCCWGLKQRGFSLIKCPGKVLELWERAEEGGQAPFHGSASVWKGQKTNPRDSATKGEKPSLVLFPH